MAKKRFSATAFRQSNEKAKTGGSGDFPVIPNGIYLVSVEKAFFREGKDSDSLNGCINFQISEDDENCKNQYIFYSENMNKRDGTPNEIGTVAFQKLLLALSDGMFDADAFVEDSDTELERFLLTEVRIKYKSTPQAGSDFRNEKVEVIGDVIVNKYSGNNTTLKPVEDSLFEDEPEVDTEAEDDDDEDEVEIGDWVNYSLKGHDYPSKVVAFADGKGDEPGKLIIIPEKTPGKERTVSEEDCTFLRKGEKTAPTEELEEELEEEEEIEEEEESEEEIMQVGSVVNSTFKGVKFTGIVRSIDEDVGIVVIGFEGKKRKCKIELTYLSAN